MAKFTKGTQCYRFTEWNREGTFVVSLVTIESWGAKQGTISYLQDGKMAQERIYTEQDAAQFLRVTECADPIAEGTKRAAKWVADQLAFHLEHRLGHPSYHQPSILKTIAMLEAATPRAGMREELIAEVVARLANKNA